MEPIDPDTIRAVSGDFSVVVVVVLVVRGRCMLFFLSMVVYLLLIKL
jgi:hypothetical protein